MFDGVERRCNIIGVSAVVVLTGDNETAAGL